MQHKKRPKYLILWHKRCNAFFVPTISARYPKCGKNVATFPQKPSKTVKLQFTTKGVGKGTGLGLATVFGIVKQHDAYISVYSEQNIGTTFKIYFPLATKTKQEVEDKKQIAAPRGRERILVVDDAPSICRVVTDTLKPLGYQVLVAYTAKDAIEIARSKEEKIDLLLTDVIMPEMNGKELADELNKSRPDMKVIFMSGYTDNVILKEGIMKHGLILINKPLIPSVLANKLRKVLDGCQRPPENTSYLTI